MVVRERVSIKNPFAIDIKFNLYKPKQPLIGKVIQNTLLTPPPAANRKRPYKEGLTYVNHIVFELPPDTFPFRCGQSAGVMPLGDDPTKTEKGLANTRYSVRLYSIASPAGGETGDGTKIAFIVTRDNTWDGGGEIVYRGVCSNYMCDWRVGDVFEMTGPSGKHFHLPDELDTHLVFIATGTGIAPFRGMMMELEKMGYDKKIYLFFGVPYSDEVCYNDFFLDLERRMPNFHYYTAISREQKNSEGGKMYVGDRMAQHLDEIAKLQKDGCLFYICGGPKGMENGVIPYIRETYPEPVEILEEWTKAAESGGTLFIETY